MRANNIFIKRGDGVIIRFSFLKKLLIFLSLFFLQNCTKIDVYEYILGKNTEIRLCEPQTGLFIDGSHFISSEFLNENNSWNYQNLEKFHREKVNSIPHFECIPIKSPKNLHEKLLEKEMIIDLTK
ncbi:MAG: hypothetical protein OEZ13_02005 [Spirochaetia bacterium]|nr:hypothetical protein [Spirochaetia bacterium]